MAGHAGLVIIIILSVIPGSARPHTGAGGGIEHWLAYLLVGASYGMSLMQPKPALAAGLALSTVAAVLEALQIFIPGRNAEFSGFAASALGSSVGLVAGYWLWRGVRRAIPRP